MAGTTTRDAGGPLLVVIGILALGAIGAAVYLTVVRSASDRDPGTPEGVAQAYFRAVLDQDDSAARSLMTPDLAARCNDGRIYIATSGSTRVVLDATDVQSGRAVVTVEISEMTDPSPFDVDGYSHRERLVMTGAPGEWSISEQPWPYFCPEGS